ncbi:MAG: diacylglycerol kinase family lipid kinase [Candidatus Alcyoniella australis]|nr:diacylglycerol kinase family lipid kinase [Candidatus Alcyoniella australis]
MTKKPRAFAVVNPNSANGSTEQEWDAIHAALEAALGELDFGFTQAVGDAANVARRAVKAGHELIISVGGDGTNNEIVNGMFEHGAPINPRARLGFVCCGTGGDLRRTLGVPKDLRQACEVLVRGNTRRIDLGRFSFFDHSGRRAERYFINITSFGIGGEIDARVNRTTKVLGGFASFLWASFASVVDYRNKPVELTVDGNPIEPRRIFNVAVANGRCFGGGMQVAPDADPADGLFDVVLIGDLTKLEVVTQMTRIYSGRHLSHPKVEVLRARRVEAHSDEIVLLDVDGEQPGRLPATFEIVPAALDVIV